jgi:hypothetical protein
LGIPSLDGLLEKVPPLRAHPTTPDAADADRVAFARTRWSSQDEALRLRDRQIEENVRMLAGQQWAVWSPLFGRFVDVTQWMSEEERRWRQRPVINRILPWFMLTHARMTENPPIITFVPGPDAEDADLAETLDVIFKAKWRDLGMQATIEEACAWLIPSGRVYLQSRIDASKGDVLPLAGGAQVPVLDPATGEPMLDEMGEPLSQDIPDGVPLDAEGMPVAALNPLTGALEPFAEPHLYTEGDLAVDVLTAMEVRGEWGPTPWHLKSYHITRTFRTPQWILDTYGIEVEADTDEITGTGDELRRLLYGAGYFGAASEGRQVQPRQAGAEEKRGLVEITTLWCAPDKTSPRAPGQPGGRLLVVTPTAVLYDGPRPVDFKYTSPIRALDFVKLPGRAHGSTPQEALNALNRSYNRGWAQILEHRNLVSNPKGIVDKGSGLGNVEITNQPGQVYEVARRPGVPPLEWIAPPPLPADVWRTQQMLREEIDDIGNMKGAGGEAPTEDASGELVKELRLNSDRYLGPTMRGIVTEIGRLAEDWQALLPVIYDQEKILSYAGDDNVARTITVMPMLFEQGSVNVVADAESMLPEGRGERQARIYKMWMDGMFGPPLLPEARAKYLSLSRFPHLSRSAKPGAADYPTAEQILGKMVAGELPAQMAPWFDWYDVTVHLDVFSTFMKSPAYLRLDPVIQGELMLRWQMLNGLLQMQMAQAMAMQAAAQGGAEGGAGAPGKGKDDGAPSLAPAAAADSPPASLPQPGMYPGAMANNAMM